MKHGQLYSGCSDRYKAYHNARGLYDATLAALEKLREAAAILDKAPSGGDELCEAVDRAIEQAEEDEPTLREELRRAERAYFGQ